MNGRTHLLLGVASGVAFANVTGQNELMPYIALVSGVGGIIADIDHPQSIISSFVPFSGIVRLFVGGHRGVTHTIAFWGVVLLLLYFIAPLWAVDAFGIGVASHLIADMITPRGVPLLAPVSNFNFTLLPSAFLGFTAWVWEAVAVVGALLVIVLTLFGRLPK